MKPWLLRGLGLTLVHVLVRVLLGAALVQWPLQGSVLRMVALAVVVLAAIVWAGLDGIRDQRAHPQSEDGADLTMLWLKAAAVTGLVAGLLTWLIDTVSPIQVGVKSLFFELTSGAAFTVLLVYVPATAAVMLGRFLVRREQRKSAPAAKPDAGSAPVGAAAAPDPGWRDDDAPTEVFERIDPDRRP
ncbi:B-4DMT family transporter [Rhodococcus aetherivorans]|uniref:B-4DMT family transporter n=1 Tax=Rhodococcus aetherivorans TaxID=191292 RepID=UPI0036C53BE0